MKKNKKYIVILFDIEKLWHLIMENFTDDNKGQRQYPVSKSVKEYETNSLNHSGPYPDLKYDKRFQLPDEKTSKNSFTIILWF